MGRRGRRRRRRGRRTPGDCRTEIHTQEVAI